MAVKVDDEPYGFLLVTADPDLKGGGKGSAYELVAARISTRTWPIYDGTRNRGRMKAGARVAFYVAGSRANAGKIVATGSVTGRRHFRQGAVGADPPEFWTEQPHIVLELGDVSVLEAPVVFKEKLPRLSFCPQNLKKWGTILMGGSRAIAAPDWAILFEDVEP